MAEVIVRKLSRGSSKANNIDAVNQFDGRLKTAEWHRWGSQIELGAFCLG